MKAAKTVAAVTTSTARCSYTSIGGRISLGLLLFLSVCATGWLSACATVSPYERETLARSDMQFKGAPEIEEAEGHATSVREGTTGGFGSGGGGCGCN